MRVELDVPESVRDPRMWIKQQPVLAMALRPGSFEVGLRRSKMIRLTYDAGEMSLVPPHWAAIPRHQLLDNLGRPCTCGNGPALLRFSLYFLSAAGK